MRTYGQGPIEEHRLQLKLSKRARGVLIPPGLLSYPRHAGVVFAAGMDAIMEAVGAFSEPCPFAEAVDEAAPASVGSQAVYPCETGGERKDYGSYYIRTNIPTGMSLFMATLHRTRSTILAVRVVVRTHGSVFGDAERLAADNRAVPLHVVRTCAMELGVARTIEAIEAVDAAGAALSLDALADHLGVAWE